MQIWVGLEEGPREKGPVHLVPDPDFSLQHSVIQKNALLDPSSESIAMIELCFESGMLGCDVLWSHVPNSEDEETQLHTIAGTPCRATRVAADSWFDSVFQV